ncbi:general substrate transporter [Phascolomyces articulosus]|uniref:General substrate transporter n=1 Tax=Phascolomyces articulosus TaxID=60185 RepID=A0AAD5K2H3_9FUNG|nr:general substrate transporter [Phascolomyces articulosus]
MGILQKLSYLPEISIQNGKKLHGRALNWGIGFIAGCGFLMFGYDQGVMSSLLTLDDFQRQFPTATPHSDANPLCSEEGMCTGTPELQSNMVSIYQIGCFLGAVLVLFYGDSWGRRSSTFWGTIIVTLGTVVQASAHDYGTLCFGRIFGGIGNGMVTSTIPTWQSECAKPEDRGFLIMNEGMLIGFGIMVSYWVDYGFYFLEGSIRWRFPIAFQAVFSLIVIAGVFILPDSPRWLLKKNYTQEAREVVARLADEEVDSEKVNEEMAILEHTLALEGEKFSYREFLRHGNVQHFRRMILGVVAQAMQQYCGINLITYYATMLFEESLGFDAAMSRLLAAINGTEYWLSAVVAMFFVERYGRRKLMFVGLVGMMASMAVLAGCLSAGWYDEFGSLIVPEVEGYVGTVTLFTFNTFFAIGFLGMTWLYPAEINPLRTRVQANALSTCSNWLSNYVIVMITPPAIANIGYGIYVIFAIFNFLFIPIVYFWYPETKGRSLEELDVMFAKANEENVSPVKMAQRMPKLEGSELERELAKYFDDGSTSDASPVDAEKIQQSSSGSSMEDIKSEK